MGYQWIVSPTGATHYFGFALKVSLLGDYILIGAPAVDNTSGGRLYLYHYNDTDYSVTSTLELEATQGGAAHFLAVDTFFTAFLVTRDTMFLPGGIAQIGTGIPPYSQLGLINKQQNTLDLTDVVVKPRVNPTDFVDPFWGLSMTVSQHETHPIYHLTVGSPLNQHIYFQRIQMSLRV